LGIQRAQENYAIQGELNTLLDRHLNSGSTKQLRAFLYDPPPAGCGFPPRYIKVGSKNTDRLSVAVDALLATYRQNKDERLRLCLLLSDRRTQLESLATKLDKDGRIRTSLNIAGTQVGRMSSYKSNTGSGFNLHTVSPRHRHLFTADPGFDFYQVDLKGADGWTIGAECAALGDTRMWDDLSAGLKPANAVVLLLRDGAVVNTWSMAKCLDEQRKLDKKAWQYLACKKGIWGTCYGLGDVALSEKILEEAWKESGELITISAADCKRLQAAIHARYPGVKRRWERTKLLLQRDGKLEACGGQVRDFFGVKTDHSTQKEAFAYTPAANTAYACHCALLALWRNTDRVTRSVQPLLTVHDSVLFQAPVEHRAWIASHIPAWFSNPLTVAGKTFVIPWETCRGDSWGTVSDHATTA
jgi:DNA polymerase I-like protein with 3'-5' exonuclease and polymerase domains